jgi:hypothetical protein
MKRLDELEEGLQDVIDNLESRVYPIVDKLESLEKGGLGILKLLRAAKRKK